MAQGRLPSDGEMFAASVANLAVRYGESEDTIAQRVYALAEQLHRHHCMARGYVTHVESRPDFHVAVSILTSLAGADWMLVRDAERVVSVFEDPSVTEAGGVVMMTGVTNLGPDGVHPVGFVVGGDDDPTQV